VATRLPTSPTCLNCGHPAERFCPRCGQKNVSYRVSLARLLRELGSELLELDSRLARTLVPFLFQPGELTRAYNAGHRARYVPPLRLYLFASLLCFVTLGIRDLVDPTQVSVVEAARSDAAVADLERETRERVDRELAKVPEELATVHGGLSFGGVGFTTAHGFDLPEPWRSYALVREVNRRVAGFASLPQERQVEILHDRLLSYMPTAIFVLLPFLALLLQLAFLGTGRYYVEHLVFTLHLHAFVYLVLAVSTAIDVGAVSTLCTAGVPLYALLAMRRVYASGWPTTLLRAGFVGVGYLILLILGVLLVVVTAMVLQ